MDDIVQKLKKLYVEVGISKIHGVCVKAIRSIPKGTTLFYSSNYNPVAYNIKHLIANGVDKNIIKNIKKYYAHDSDIIEIDPNRVDELSYINYLNHSPEPNIEVITKNYVTRKNIKRGEELTINYKENNYCPTCIDFKVKKKTHRKKREKKINTLKHIKTH